MRFARGQAALAVGLAGLVIGLVLVAVVYRPAPSQGPLRHVEVVNSFGFPVEGGQPFSFVIRYRSQQPATAVLRSVELGSADAGLELIGAGIGNGELFKPFVPRYPPAPLQPLEGAVVTLDPTAQPAEDLIIVLGLRADATSGKLDAREIWLNYEVDGQHFRARVPWLLRVCIEPHPGACKSQPASEYQFGD
jgi:hypothetical protein